jgi:hypothetical protein
MTFVRDKGRNGNGDGHGHGSVLLHHLVYGAASLDGAKRPTFRLAPLVKSWDVAYDLDRNETQGEAFGLFIKEALEAQQQNGNHNDGLSVSTKSTALDDIHSQFANWLELPTGEHRYDHIDIALAVVIATRFEIHHPVWIFLVGPPSTSKTEILQALDNVPDIHRLSSMSTKTFASGFITGDGSDVSLLLDLNDKTIVMKDFTTVLSMRYDVSTELYGQLREIYDGSFVREWGVKEDGGAPRKRLDWHGKVGLLAGVTDVIDKVIVLRSTLGERFLMYRIPKIDQRRQGLAALRQHAKKGEDKQGRIKIAVGNYLHAIGKPAIVSLSESMQNGIVALARYIALGRAATTYSSYGEVSFVSDPEGSSRLSQQLALLAMSLAVVRGEKQLTSFTFETIVQVAHDTIPATRSALLRLLLAHPNGVDLKTAMLGSRYKESMVRNHLSELVAIELAEELRSHPIRWIASDLLRGLMADVAVASMS